MLVAGATGVDLDYYTRGVVVVDPSAIGEKKIIFPVTVPAVLYGQPVRIAGLRVYYKSSGPNSFIQDTYLFREKMGTLDTPDSVAYDLIAEVGASHNSITGTYYDLACASADCTLSADEGFLTVRLDLMFNAATDAITIGGIRLTLEHD